MHFTLKLVERTLESNPVFSGVLLHVNRDQVILPNGSNAVREWIKHPGACAVVPFFDNGDVMLLKQYRYPVKQLFWEVPAGKIDQGEPPEVTAERELQEETGVKAGELHYIGHFYPCIGYSDEVIHIYTATDLTIVASNADEDEFVEPVRISFDEALRMVDSGEINDGKTVICLLRAKSWLEKNKK
ncbi:MAG: NUDIX hydrolase [Balneolales bacterium]|nr:NUDIX hydrolase [Balneolales bacterium]